MKKLVYKKAGGGYQINRMRLTNSLPLTILNRLLESDIVANLLA